MNNDNNKWEFTILYGSTDKSEHIHYHSHYNKMKNRIFVGF